MQLLTRFIGQSIALTAGSTIALCMASSAHAAPVLFDFEEIPTGPYTSLTMNRPGLTVTVSRTPTSNQFNIVDISSISPPAGWGSRTLSPFDLLANDGFLFDISAPATFVSIETADYFADSDVVSLTAYDAFGGTGNIVDTVTINWGVQGPPAVAILQTSSPSILSVVARGGSISFPASMYWDNLTIDTKNGPKPVPAPLPILGAAAVFGSVRKLRKFSSLLKTNLLA